MQNLLATIGRRLAPRAASAVAQGAAHRSMCDGPAAANPPGALHAQRLLRLKKEELVSRARVLGLPVSALDAHPGTPALPVAGPPGLRSSPFVHVHISLRTDAYRLALPDVSRG